MFVGDSVLFHLGLSIIPSGMGMLPARRDHVAFERARRLKISSLIDAGLARQWRAPASLPDAGDRSRIPIGQSERRWRRKKLDATESVRQMDGNSRDEQYDDQRDSDEGTNAPASITRPPTSSTMMVAQPQDLRERKVDGAKD